MFVKLFVIVIVAVVLRASAQTLGDILASLATARTDLNGATTIPPVPVGTAVVKYTDDSSPSSAENETSKLTSSPLATSLSSSSWSSDFVSASPAPSLELSSTETENPDKMSSTSTADANPSSTFFPLLNAAVREHREDITAETVDDKDYQMQTSPSSTVPSTEVNTATNSRRSRNDLYFCCSDEISESTTVTSTDGKERERNTRLPVLTSDTTPTPELPFSERKPALLVRFFPDGTAVLISKFQVYLHVKPKRITFGGDDQNKNIENAPLSRDISLPEEKTYEVTYKRLEAIPAFKSNINNEEVDDEVDDEDGTENNNDEEENHDDHEFVTSSLPTTTASPEEANRIKAMRLSTPILEPLISSTPEETFEDDLDTTDFKQYREPEVTTEMEVGNPYNSSRERNEDETEPNDEDLFVTQVSPVTSITKEYQPVQRLPFRDEILITTVNSPPNSSEGVISTTSQSTTDGPTTTTTTLPTTEDITSTATATTTTTVETTSVNPKCSSFSNQLSLALSTEDNIGNPLLKRHFLPLRDCNLSEEQSTHPFSPLQLPERLVMSQEQTTTELPQQISTLPLPTRPQRELLPVPYKLRHPSRVDVYHPEGQVVVVTSSPMIIDARLRSQPVTALPAWREVTVGVVRDHQGQPLKPKRGYNNWTAHLRGLRKKMGQKTFKDDNTSNNNNRSLKEPLMIIPPQQQQTYQPSPSQINRSFWGDFQQQRTANGGKLWNGNKLFSSNKPLKDLPQTQNKQSLSNVRINPLRSNANKTSFWRNRSINNNNNSNTRTDRKSNSNNNNHSVFLHWNQMRNNAQQQQQRNNRNTRIRTPTPNLSQEGYEGHESQQQQQWNSFNRWHGNTRW